MYPHSLLSYTLNKDASNLSSIISPSLKSPAQTNVYLNIGYDTPSIVTLVRLPVFVNLPFVTNTVSSHFFITFLSSFKFAVLVCDLRYSLFSDSLTHFSLTFVS